jgi:hypothetical protein
MWSPEVSDFRRYQSNSRNRAMLGEELDARLGPCHHFGSSRYRCANRAEHPPHGIFEHMRAFHGTREEYVIQRN